MLDRNKHMASGKGRWTVRKKIEGETQKREIAQERRKVVKKKNERPTEEKNESGRTWHTERQDLHYAMRTDKGITRIETHTHTHKKTHTHTNH